MNHNLEAMANWIAFPSEHGRRVCDACPKKAGAAVLVRYGDGKINQVFVCRDHLLDPGPLLDY